jgi:nitroreductase
MIGERWSPRVFSERIPEDEKLCSLFEAARLAPSAHNAQPTRFLLARKHRGSAHSRLFDCLDEKNRVWADSAPVLILAAVMRKRFSQHDGALVPYSHFMHDLGLAVMSLILQAQALGLYTHPMAAFDPEQARAAFEVPPLFEPAMVIAVGYLGDPERVPEALREREHSRRYRRPLEELVYEEHWGLATSLFSTPPARTR